MESNGLSVLDIVKHAVRTTVEVLGDRDRLALVKYSDNAETVFSLQNMTVEGKAKAQESLDTLRADGQTNLWGGLCKVWRLARPFGLLLPPRRSPLDYPCPLPGPRPPPGRRGGQVANDSASHRRGALMTP